METDSCTPSSSTCRPDFFRPEAPRPAAAPPLRLDAAATGPVRRGDGLARRTGPHRTVHADPRVPRRPEVLAEAAHDLHRLRRRPRAAPPPAGRRPLEAVSQATPGRLHRRRGRPRLSRGGRRPGALGGARRRRHADQLPPLRGERTGFGSGRQGAHRPADRRHAAVSRRFRTALGRAAGAGPRRGVDAVDPDARRPAETHAAAGRRRVFQLRDAAAADDRRPRLPDPGGRQPPPADRTGGVRRSTMERPAPGSRFGCGRTPNARRGTGRCPCG